VDKVYIEMVAFSNWPEIGGKMEFSGTSGLAMYQQTVSQTPGMASSIWVQSTSVQPPILVQVIPTNMGKRENESLEEKTASKQ
jgi:hypothetical protein